MSVLEADLRIPAQSRIIIAGSSKSGKTRLCYNLLKNSSLVFENPFEEIFWFYMIYQKFYDKLKRKLKNIQFFQGLDELEKVLSDKSLFEDKKIYLVIDDLQEEAYASSLVSKIFCIFAHHLPIEQCIFIVQNPLIRAKYQTTINRNANILILTKSARLKGAMIHIGQQVFPGKGKILMEAYDKAMSTSEEEYPYLICNFDTVDNRLQFFSGILLHERICFFVSDKNF